MKKLILITLILLPFSVFAQFIDGPESVAFDKLNNRYLISSLNNGRIVEIDLYGEQQLLHDFSVSVLGNCVDDNFFYFSTPNEVYIMDLLNDEIVNQIPIPESSQLDGMTTDNNGFLYVVDGLAKKIFKINLATNEVSTFASGIELDMAQDLYFDSKTNRILMCPYRANAPIYSIDIITAEFDTLIETSIGFFDGITLDENSNIYVSNFQDGEIWQIDSSLTTEPYLLKRNINQPSGLDYNQSLKVLAIPSFDDDKIIFLEDDFKRINFQEHLAAGFAKPAGIFAADLNSDGFKDILSASSASSGVFWFQNDGEEQTSWQAREIDGSLTNALYVYAGFINNDTLCDVVAASWQENTICWYENLGGTTLSWTRHDVSTNFNGAHEVMLFDVDKNGTMDILGAAAESHEISIWYNSGGASPSWTKEVIDQNASGARSIAAEDIDGDGDIDLASASLESHEMTWYRNDGESWMEITIDDTYALSHKVFLTDMDNDGDVDILGSAYQEQNITWWENITFDSTYWIKHEIEDNFINQVIAHAIDLDADGQKDIVATSQGLHDIKWYRNDSYNSVEQWETIDLNLNFGGVWPLLACDMDNDGDNDIIAGGNNSNQIRYWENTLQDSATQNPVASISKSANSSCVGGSITFESTSLGEISNYSWYFNEGANPASSTEQGPIDVAYTTQGIKEITLIVAGSNGSDTTKTFIFIDNELHANIYPKDPEICSGTPTLMHIKGADSAVWEPSTYLNSPNQTFVTCTPYNDITYTITAFKGSLTSEITQTVLVDHIEYDDVCSAKQLNFGYNLGLTNECASVQENEPHPPLTGCTGQHSWCNEGGLQNSVWFKFEAPQSGNVKINTSGFDNQIALYNAESCEDILLGNFEILYANDDFNPDASAQISNATGLISGKTYWLQVDGSFGGQVGEFYIELSELESIKNIDYEEGMLIRPNPNNGNFEIELNNQFADCQLSLHSMQGLVLFQKNYTHQKKIEIANLNLNPGVYFCTVSTDGQTYNKKVIIK